ncbi:unnamed protein product [Zymoseptoria tritici ST99CH_3D7]|uniref:Uncharacterized protein n=1 Tax=Zymoseptoria tritici (strain ST99CH_3D7) TaxID=1276538 RepID=A0A1X7RH69_ZYMT9|nr:unnamed protein product [Zymoseptoria tritici ST99CH_3D7]
MLPRCFEVMECRHERRKEGGQGQGWVSWPQAQFPRGLRHVVFFFVISFFLSFIAAFHALDQFIIVVLVFILRGYILDNAIGSRFGLGTFRNVEILANFFQTIFDTFIAAVRIMSSITSTTSCLVCP